MADPIRLYSEFTDDLGGDWRVNIHDANFTGTTQTFVLGADGFVLRYAGNNEDRYQTVIGSEVTFTVMEENSTHTGFMDDLATAAEQRFSVSIYKDPDGTNEFWWGGVLYPEQVVRPFEYFPVEVLMYNLFRKVSNILQYEFNLIFSSGKVVKYPLPGSKVIPGIIPTSGKWMFHQIITYAVEHEAQLIF